MHQAQNDVKKFKIVFLGEQNVGKSSLISRFVYDSFETTYEPTIGIDFLTTTMNSKNKTVRVQLWDTAGQERFRSLIPTYTRNTTIAVIVYDITDLFTFEQSFKWIEEIKDQCGLDTQIILVGNKSDLEENRKISTKHGLESAMKIGVAFTETSAKENVNIKELFNMISSLLPRHLNESPDFHVKLEEEQKEDEKIKKAESKCSC